MKIKDIKLTKIDRTLTALDTDSIPCDYCDKVNFHKGDVVHKAKFSERYCNSSLYVCPSCFAEHNNPSSTDDIFKDAHRNRGQKMANISGNAKTL